jgi:hypothetical protein
VLPDTHTATDLLAPFYALSSAERRRRLERASTALNASEVAEGEDVRQGQRGLFVIRKDNEGLSVRLPAPSFSAEAALLRRKVR